MDGAADGGGGGGGGGDPAVRPGALAVARPAARPDAEGGRGRN